MNNKFSTFVCQNCGSETSQYFGRCLNCKEWNTIVEENKTQIFKTKKNKPQTKKAKLFDEITSEKISRFSSGFQEFDRVLGGGIVPGSVVLLGGEPGIGKSTIILQAAGKYPKKESFVHNFRRVSRTSKNQMGKTKSKL